MKRKHLSNWSDDDMIDEDRTMQLYGYTSSELKSGSDKPIVAVCDGCGRYRDSRKRMYRELCVSCAQKKRCENPEEIKAMSERQIKYMANPDARLKMSQSTKKRYSDPLERAKTSGENNYNWRGGRSFGKYCPKFNNTTKQYIRDKYNNCDYISGIPAHVCNSTRSLDVHHIDYNKQQGCDDHEWILIPLSKKNHSMTNFNRPFWNRLFTYSLQYDETYYDDEPVDIWRILCPT